MAVDEQVHHIALPKLYGMPAYARPPRPVAELERPLDPDDLPLEAEATPEEREVLSELRTRPFMTVSPSSGLGPIEPPPQLRPRPFLVRALAGRLPRGES